MTENQILTLMILIANSAIGFCQVCPGAVCPGQCPVDGGWGNWSPWSECSTNCGSGQITRMRACDSPRPKKGGKMCEGETAEFSPCSGPTCSAESCSESTLMLIGGSLDRRGRASTQVELIPKGDSRKSCLEVAPYPNNVMKPVATFIGGKVLSCGGSLIDSEFLNHNSPSYPLGQYATDQCFQLDIDANVWNKVSPMIERRKDAEAIMIDENTWWVTGGRRKTDDTTLEYHNTTEFYHISNGYFTPGPTMPQEMMRHCMVRINETTILLATLGHVMFFYDIESKTFGDPIFLQSTVNFIPPFPGETLQFKGTGCQRIDSGNSGRLEVAMISQNLRETYILDVIDQSWRMIESSPFNGFFRLITQPETVRHGFTIMSVAERDTSADLQIFDLADEKWLPYPQKRTINQNLGQSGYIRNEKRNHQVVEIPASEGYCQLAG